MLNRFYKSTTAAVKFLFTNPDIEHEKIQEIQSALHTLDKAGKGNAQKSIDEAIMKLSDWRQQQKMMKETQPDEVLNPKRDAMSQLAAKFSHVKLLMLASTVISNTTLLFLFLLNENQPLENTAYHNLTRLGLIGLTTASNMFFNNIRRLNGEKQQIATAELEAIDQALCRNRKKTV